MSTKKLTREEEQLEFKKMVMTTKMSLLNRIAKTMTSVNDPNGWYKDKTVYFQKTLNELLSRFFARVQSAPLFDELEMWWGYRFTVEEAGIKLYLCHYPGIFFYDFGGELEPAEPDAEYLLIEEKPRMLSVEAYAKKCGVEPVTVRQWIRRGKLSGVFKVGKEWVIPELTEKPDRGYERRGYSWRSGVVKWPKDYEFLDSVGEVDIFQNPNNANEFILEYPGEEDIFDRKKISAQEREKFEMFLITNPSVDYVESVYITYI